MSIMVWQQSRGAASSAARHALAVLVLTSVRHAYGAYVYATPWRYHAVFVSAVTAPVILGSLAVLRARRTGLPGALSRAIFGLVTLGVPVSTIGAFEGLYNHVAKNVLYAGGASSSLLTTLFPPPTYEMPNDVLNTHSTLRRTGEFRSREDRFDGDPDLDRHERAADRQRRHERPRSSALRGMDGAVAGDRRTSRHPA